MNENTILHHALALDSIYKLITWDDRIYLHGLIRTKSQEQITETLRQAQSDKLTAVLEWISDTGWTPPQMRYGHDRLLYYESQEPRTKNQDYEPVENYPGNHPEITKQIKKLKI